MIWTALALLVAGLALLALSVHLGGNARDPNKVATTLVVIVTGLGCLTGAVVLALLWTFGG